MTAKHTATPYGVAKYSPEHKGDGQMIYIASARKPINSNVCLVGMDTDPQHEADAAFIVTACNCHDDLLMCAKLLRELGEISEVWHAVFNQCGIDAFDKARAAIAKAEGEKCSSK